MGTLASACDSLLRFMVGDEIDRINKESLAYHNWLDTLAAVTAFPCTVSVWRLTAAKALLHS
jgi:hypothetical protein